MFLYCRYLQRLILTVRGTRWCSGTWQSLGTAMRMLCRGCPSGSSQREVSCCKILALSCSRCKKMGQYIP